MYGVLAQMAALIVLGVFWRVRRPLGLDADEVRRAITGLVYTLLLPALVLLVLWQAPLGMDVVKVALVAASGVIAGLVVSIFIYRWMATSSAVAGAMILAAGFPNATYLGLPVLESTLGPWARSVAIQYDLFACTPLLLTVGMMVGRAYGQGEDNEHPLRAMLKIPPLWAAIIALLLNGFAVPIPTIAEQWLQMLGGAVVPLMLIALGMGLRWANFTWASVPVMLPVLVIQLLLMPLLVWQLGGALELSGELLAAVVLEAAMPCMVLGLVICDRYKVDTGLYATAVTVSTALAMISLPLWFEFLV